MVNLIENFKTLDSTKDLAEKYIIEQKYSDHFLLIAEEQKKGKGRKGNDWVSPKEGLWFSLGLKHISEQKTFTLFIGYCVLKALNDICSQQMTPPQAEKHLFQIKWPNDIYLYEKKICGLICSQHAHYGMTNIGIGINTNIKKMPETAPQNADSILNLLNIYFENEVYLSAILNNIFENLPIFEQKRISLFYDYYTKHDFLENKKLIVNSGAEVIEGVYNGIDIDGGLLLKEKNGNIKSIFSGIVSIV